MKIKKIHAIYFSPGGTCRTVVAHLAQNINALLSDVPNEVHDFTLPSGRAKAPDICHSELVIVGLPVNILKVKPETTDTCIDCKLCAKICPMGAIDFQNPVVVPGVCIKCNTCIKNCPTKAKQLVDAAYLSHVRFLEENYTQRANIELF